MPIPVIDLFAGPGGLSEGFSSLHTGNGNRLFDIRLSIEKEPVPHRTLELRAFFRQFPIGEAPEEYYAYMRGDICRESLFGLYPQQAQKARSEAWCAELGKNHHLDVMERIHQAMRVHCHRWVLIGGPPCQAYSLAGRSRRNKDTGFAGDKRHFLYREYLRIIAERQPAVFVMENVQGILSSRAENEGIFERILRDLRCPHEALCLEAPHAFDYQLYSLDGEADTKGEARSFLVRAENYGIPQARPRVFVLGVRSDLTVRPRPLQRHANVLTVEQAIGDLPPLCSRFSRRNQCELEWHQHIAALCEQAWFAGPQINAAVRAELCQLAARLPDEAASGALWLAQCANPQWQRDWYHDPRLNGIAHHEARGHMPSDLWRYFFAATFARIEGRSPALRDFPLELRPNHANVQQAVNQNSLFSDRFRVQLHDRPSTTVVSHISKDGHYYIHPDPLQCRSLTVREAARLQTFPDNYFFEGTRTAQFHQVGNAVPPLLARQIGALVHEVLR